MSRLKAIASDKSVKLKVDTKSVNANYKTEIHLGRRIIKGGSAVLFLALSLCSRSSKTYSREG